VSDEGPQHATGVHVGQILAGKYRVELVLGVGGMGVVIAAHHIQLDTRVALKLLLPGMLTNQEALTRFTREARAAIQMTSSHAARVFDVGTLESGAPYIVMEYLDGADLGTLLQQQGPLEVVDAVGFVLQACEAVAEAHALGIVHRDLKPSNLFLCRRADGRRDIKVLDFGISKVAALASAPDQTLTQVTSLVGSPLYMSPEQIEAPHTVDTRTDIWALGVLLYELLSNKTPFCGNTLPQVSIKIAVRPPVPLRELRPEVADGLAAVIARCLEKDRTWRYANVGELALALLPFGPEQAQTSVDRIADCMRTAGLSDTGSSAPRSTRPTTVPVSREIDAPFRSTIPSPKLRGAKAPSWVIVAAVLALVVVLAVGLTAPKQRAAWGLAVGAVAAGPARSVIEPRAPPALPPETTAAVPAAQAWSVASVASKPAPPVERPQVTPQYRTTSYHTAPVSPATPAAIVAKPGRDPDFDLDDQGRKHFKPACVTPARTTAQATLSKVDCDPNFDLDDNGRKHFKPACFLNFDPMKGP
jgi:eukaryotic-like serine/threonine-protein kinase